MTPPPILSRKPIRPSTVPLLAIVLAAITGFSECEEDPFRIVFIDGLQETTFTQAQTFTIVATAPAVDGATITQVRFYHNDEPDPAGVDTDGEPYTHSWDISGDMNGTHRWYAEAIYDRAYAEPVTVRSDEVLYTVAIIPVRRLSPPSAGVEAACSAIGAACVCSEPLNVNQATPASTFINPIDSTDKECRGEGGAGNSFYARSGGPVLEEFGMPDGNTVDWVWSVNAPGIANLHGNAGTYSNGTLCTRVYQRFSDDLVMNDGDDRIKLMEVSGPGFLHQMQWTTFLPADHLNDLFIGFGFEGNLDQRHGSGEAVTLRECRSSWCRMEQCHDLANGTLVVRSRVVVVDTGKTFTMTSPPMPTGSLDAERVWIGNLFTQNVFQGRRYVSHGMQAFWSGGSGEWIGAACEVEGTSEWGTCR